jgi:nucleoside phosphorylase
MGQERMLGALEWMLGESNPDLVIVAGFAGALTGELAVGDACIGESFVAVDLTSHSEARPGISLEISERLVQFCEGQGLRRTQIVTIDQPAPKQRLSRQYENSISIVDMESYFVGRFCHEKNIPFLSFRAVSDGFLDEIDFEIRAIADPRGHVRVSLVLGSILRDPRLLKSYTLSWKRSIKAGRSLGKVLANLINLHSAELLSLVQETAYIL